MKYKELVVFPTSEIKFQLTLSGFSDWALTCAFYQAYIDSFV